MAEQAGVKVAARRPPIGPLQAPPTALSQSALLRTQPMNGPDPQPMR